MAIQRVVAVYDFAVEAYGRPVFVNALGEATRSFLDEVNSPDSAMSRHPADYSLFHIGEFDSSSGVLTAHTPVKLLMKGGDAKQSSS